MKQYQGVVGIGPKGVCREADEEHDSTCPYTVVKKEDRMMVVG